jgi:DNA-directed RNA polymerase subunit beta'
MLQEAVDALFDNGRRSRAVRGQGNRPLKSLSDMLKGKQGRFRQNLLGKRVDYSGRSVIVVGPELKLNQCGLPKNMALELFKPFIIRKLEDRGYVQTVKSAKRLVEREKPEVWDILGEIIENHPVLLNRAPTLHRLGIQGFEPVLVEGKAIRIHPLVCQAFNADFDGDQMAVHVPLSFEAQIETSLLMLSSQNILSPAHGRPLATPNQDIVLGCHYLTKPRGEIANPRLAGSGAKLADDDPRRLRAFYNTAEVRAAYDAAEIRLHGKIALRSAGLTLIKGGDRLGFLETTAGRVLFSEVVPGTRLHQRDHGQEAAREPDRRLLQALRRGDGRSVGRTQEPGLRIRDAGRFHGRHRRRADSAGEARDRARARVEVNQINANYRRGVITEGERYNKVIDTWTHATTDVEEVTFEGLSRDREGFNPIFMMADSGSRGNREQIRQLAGMRGLMAKPQKKITGGLGEIIESPVTHNFKEGCRCSSTSSRPMAPARPRRHRAQDRGCRLPHAASRGRGAGRHHQRAGLRHDSRLERRRAKDGEDIIEPLADRVLGRVAAEDVVHPISSETLVEAGQLVDEEIAERTTARRSRASRRCAFARCSRRRTARRFAKCYGRNLATGRPVDLGEATGVIAAQSIGEPGTQLTLRTFHIGGTASRIVEQSRTASKEAGTVRFKTLDSVQYRGDVLVCVGRSGEIELLDASGRVRQRYTVPYGAHLFVHDGQAIGADQALFEWDIYNMPLVTERGGTVRFVDVKDKVTVRDEVDDTSGMKLLVIMENRNKSCSRRSMSSIPRPGPRSPTTRCRPARASKCATARKSSRAIRWSRPGARRPRPATSRADSRASRSCSRRGVRRMRRSFPKSTTRGVRRRLARHASDRARRRRRHARVPDSAGQALARAGG